MHWWKRLLLNNWHLKLFSLIIATALWIVVAQEAISEIGIDVSLEYQNVPASMEVLSNATNTVEVRLRGPSALIREVSPQDVSATIDLAGMPKGVQTIPLTARHVRAPFGLEVVTVIPARVRVAVEPTVSKNLNVTASLTGNPAEWFEVDHVSITPASVTVEGPASRVDPLDEIRTSPIDISGRRETVRQTIDLDVLVPLIRFRGSQNVEVEVEIRERRRDVD